MGFKITKDKVHTAPEHKAWDKVGEEFGKYKGGKHKFRLLDDDGEIYFYGYSDCDSSFAPLDWSMPLWGCVDIQYKNPITKEYDSL